VPGVVDPCGGTIGSSVFTSDLMLWAVVVAAAAVATLVAIDRREPARRRPVVPRDTGDDVALEPEPMPPLPARAVSVRQLPTLRYRRTPLWRRLMALGGLGVIGVILGVLLAIAVAAALIALLFLVNSAAR
jgi:hypothetical protein